MAFYEVELGGPLTEAFEEFNQVLKKDFQRTLDWGDIVGALQVTLYHVQNVVETLSDDREKGLRCVIAIINLLLEMEIDPTTPELLKQVFSEIKLSIYEEIHRGP